MHIRTIYNDLSYSTEFYTENFIRNMASKESKCIQSEYRDGYFVGDIVELNGKRYMITKNGVVSNTEKIPFSKELKVIYPCKG